MEKHKNMKPDYNKKEYRVENYEHDSIVVLLYFIYACIWVESKKYYYVYKTILFHSETYNPNSGIHHL